MDNRKIADDLEAEYLAVANGVKKPAKIAMEPMVRAVEALRATPTPLADAAAIAEREAFFYGPYEVSWIGAGVWAGITDELPGELFGKKVFIVNSDVKPERTDIWKSNLRRVRSQWEKCDPEAMSKMSQAAIYHALNDAKRDVLMMHALLDGEPK